jgi:hypothetical protein
MNINGIEKSATPGTSSWKFDAIANIVSPLTPTPAKRGHRQTTASNQTFTRNTPA